MLPIFFRVEQFVFWVWLALKLFNFYAFHFIEPICNKIVVSFREAQQIIIVLVPYHKRRAYGITFAVLPINFFVLFIVIEAKERYLLVLVYRAFDCICVIDK